MNMKKLLEMNVHQVLKIFDDGYTVIDVLRVYKGWIYTRVVYEGDTVSSSQSSVFVPFIDI